MLALVRRINFGYLQIFQEEKEIFQRPKQQNDSLNPKEGKL